MRKTEGKPGRRSGAAIGIMLVSAALAACVDGPTVPFSTKTPALTLVPVGEADVKDRRARFRTLLCATIARDEARVPSDCDRFLWRLVDEPNRDTGPVDVGAPQLAFRVVVDPGLGADCMAGIARPFADALAPLRAQGYAVEVLSLGNLGGSTSNARNLADAILGLPQDGRPLVIIGYSRGAADGLEALATMPDLRPHVAAFVAMAGTVNGSALAEHVPPALVGLARLLPGAECGSDDDRGVEELRPPYRLTRRAELPPIPEVPLYSLVTFIDRPEVSPILRPTWDILARIDARNDGQMLAWDQILPRSSLLGFLRADHLMPIAPVGPLLPWWARDLVNGEDFPRAAVLEAILRIVEEDLLASGRPISPPPAP